MTMKNPIFDIENWKEIGATLARNKTRTFLTAFGIFWGTAMLALLLGGSHGLEFLLRRNFNGFATNTGVMFTNRTTIAFKGYNKGRSWSMNTSDIEQIRRAVPEITALTTLDSYSSTVAYGDKHTTAQLQGVDSDYPQIYLPKIYEGRFINAADDAQLRKVCVIGKTVADNIFPGISPLDKFVSVNGIYYKVVGVAGQTSEMSINGRLEESVVIPSSTMRRSYSLGNEVEAVMFLVKDGVSPTDIKPRITRILSNNHSLHPDDKQAIAYWDVSEQFAIIDNLFMGISVLALFVGVGSLLAGIIGVGNIMWVIVKERTQEIGIRRAIGAKPRDIIVQILSEGVVLTSVAGIAGICFAVMVLAAFEAISVGTAERSIFQLSFSNAIGILTTFLVLGTLAVVIPAVKAMKIKPIEAMNDK